MKNLAQFFNCYLQKGLDKKSVGQISKGSIHSYTRAEYQIILHTLMQGLVPLGLVPQCKVGILSHTSLEWHLIDMAVMLARGIVVPIYPNYLAEQAAFIINHAECGIVFLENDPQFEKFLTIQGETTQVHTVITFRDISPTLQSQLRPEIKHLTYQDLLAIGRQKIQENPQFWDFKLGEVQGQDIASIIYTSGLFQKYK